MSKRRNSTIVKGVQLFLFLAVVVVGATGKVWADAAAAAAPTSLKGFMNYDDFTWVNGNTHEKDFPMDGKIFSPELLFDSNYTWQASNPNDHMINGSTATNMSNEVEVQHVGLGGDFHVDNIHARFMSEFGMYANGIPRNDQTPARGGWNIQLGTMYFTEAYGGFHLDIAGTDGMNVELGQFPSYVGLYSFYNSENWTYQASYVSSNTPWFFTGMRIQFFPNDTLKIEPWLINGWQTYGAFDDGIGGIGFNFGFELRWAPNPDLVVISNNYAGPDNAVSPNCVKYHTDDSLVVKYLDDPKSGGITKMAFSLTCDAGMQQGPLYMGVGSAGTTTAAGLVVGPDNYLTVGPDQESFLGFMFYDRTWFAKDTMAFTFGGGAMTNPGRYLALLPSIGGATAATYATTPGTGAFSTGPGLLWQAWDADVCLQIMPSQYYTFDLEWTHRHSSIPYFNGHGGETSTDGWTAGGATGSTQLSGGFVPDLQNDEDLIMGAFMIHI